MHCYTSNNINPPLPIEKTVVTTYVLRDYGARGNCQVVLQNMHQAS
ncbi:hypothetical protein ACHAXS_013028 [Conticribra weissflogii]